MSGSVSICNRALISCGESQRIFSLDEETQAARACKALYDDTRKSVLESHPWGFASKRVDLGGPVTDAPVVEFSHAYLLPVDCLRVVTVFDAQGQELENEEWEREGVKIVCNCGERIYIKYTHDVADTNMFTQSFKEAFILKLAADLSEILVKQNSLSERLHGLYERKLRAAKSTSATEQSQKPYFKSQWGRR
ncbi:MAG: hypothetical protein ACNI27_07400 [Desulfovibrio sp.]